jgi:DNA polymerase I
VDFSQMELRDLAHLANAKSMIEVYHQGGDIHTFTACRIAGLNYSKLSDLASRETSLYEPEKEEWETFSLNHRLPAKTVNFGIVYGISWKGLQAQFALSGLFWDETECKDFIARWFNLYPEVAEYLRLQEYRARRYGCVWTPCGRIRLVPEIRSCHPYKRSEGIRQAGNMPIQGCNAEQTKLVMGELEEEFCRMRADGVDVEALLPIHDEIISETDEDSAYLVGEIKAQVFRDVMVDKQSGVNLWRVPINADAKITERWAKVA